MIFANNYEGYNAEGWLGTLPVNRDKELQVAGYSGKKHADIYPDIYQLEQWAQGQFSDSNIALRMPRNVIGIDVDDYDDKNGAAELAGMVAKWGPLPATYTSTARGEGQPSRIHFFLIPDGLEWPGNASPSIEIVRHGHRYAVVSPSINAKTDTVYRWYAPDGSPSDVIPNVDELPELPERWIAGLTGGAAETVLPEANLNPTQIKAWLNARNPKPMCREMSAQVRRTEDSLKANGHDSLITGVYSAVCLASEGHSGILDALELIEEEFFAATGDRRTASAIEGEWDRALDGAVRKVVAKKVNDSKCWCHINFTPSSSQPLPEFPLAALPEVVRAMVEASADNMQGKPDMAAQVALGMLSAAVQGRLDVKVPGWSGAVPALLWTFTLADSGADKSPTFNHMGAKLLPKMELELRQSEYNKVAAYINEVEYLRKRIAEMGKKSEGYNSWEMAQAREKLVALEDNPIELAKLSVNDVTPEMLAVLMRGQEGRMCLVSPEGHELLSALGMRYSSGSEPNVTFILKSSGKETTSRDRKGDNESITVYNPALTLCVAMQKDIASGNGAFTNTRIRESGFLMRANWSMPETDAARITRGRAADIPEDVSQAWIALITDTLRIFRSLSLDETVTLSFTPEAEEIFFDRDYRFRVAAAKLDGAGMERSYLRKDMDKVARVAALIHLARVGADALVSGKSLEIDANDITAAIAVCDYSLAHFKRIFNLDDHDPRDADLTTLVEGVKGYLTKQGITSGEVRLSKSALRGNSRAWKGWKFDRLKPALDMASELGLFRIEFMEEGKIAFKVRVDDVNNYLQEEN